MSQPEPVVAPEKARKSLELYAFLFLSFVLVPVLSVALIGGYGFFIWISQIIFGPPTG